MRATGNIPVIYLLDVTYACSRLSMHDLHERADRWLNDLQQADPSVHLATCSITGAWICANCLWECCLATTSAWRKSI